MNMNLSGINGYVTRCGYTGEDGFEISVTHDKVEELCSMLLSHPDVKLAGLGARDSLRLEAGLCLYGHDLNESISPVEASLLWTIGKRRRQEGGFLGARHILKQIQENVTKKRVGFVVQGAPARENALIYANGVEIGKVTSGCPSPSLKKNVGMGYVLQEYSKNGTEVEIKVRNKLQKAVITKMPFIESKYHRIK
jgi:aminomethyltransferase